MSKRDYYEVLGVSKSSKKDDKEKDNVVDAEVVDGKEDKEKRA